MNLLLISNTWFFVIVAVVLLHIIGGFAYLMYKIYKKSDDKKETPPSN